MGVIDGIREARARADGMENSFAVSLVASVSRAQLESASSAVGLQKSSPSTTEQKIEDES